MFGLLLRTPQVHYSLKLSKSFARAVSKNQASTLKHRIEKQKEEKTPKNVRILDEDERLDPKDDSVTDKQLSHLHMKTQLLPDKVLKRIAKVFGKYPHAELRQMGSEYLKFYQILHAVERPLDITEFEKTPFRNTSDLYKVKPSLVWQMKGKKSSSAFFEQLKQEEKERDQEITKKAKENEKKNADDDGKTISERLPLTKMEKKATKDADPMYSLIEYDENMALAFLVRKFPESFATSIRILSELKYRFQNEEIKTMLDYGAGLGATSLAFEDLFPNPEFVVNVEPSDSMRRLGRYITQESSNTTWVSSLADTLRFDQHKTYDIVSVCNVLEEMGSPEQRLSALADLWKKVRPGGFFVFVEPGSPMGFRFVNDARNYFLSLSREEANIVAPCPHQHSCPMAKKNKVWCNFEQMYERYPKDVLSKEPREHMDKSGHFSYIVVKKGPILTTSLLAKTPQEKSLFWPRIIKPTLIRKGHVILDLCTTAGTLEKRIISKNHNEDDKSYKHSRIMKWGDLWPIPMRIPNRFRKTAKRGKRLW
jgi:ribosomal protein RSM22 (predicted rRNA methylase)